VAVGVQCVLHCAVTVCTPVAKAVVPVVTAAASQSCLSLLIRLPVTVCDFTLLSIRASLMPARAFLMTIGASPCLHHASPCLHHASPCLHHASLWPCLHHASTVHDARTCPGEYCRYNSWVTCIVSRYQLSPWISQKYRISDSGGVRSVQSACIREAAATSSADRLLICHLDPYITLSHTARLTYLL
jgi:hypothetical protein